MPHQTEVMGRCQRFRAQIVSTSQGLPSVDVATFCEFNAPTHDEVLDCARHKKFVRRGKGCHPGRYVNSQPCEVFASDLAFTGMKAKAEVNAK